MEYTTLQMFKVVVLGGPSVGKTSFIKSAVHDIFTQNYKATIGVDFSSKVLEDGKLQIWDVGSVEVKRNLTSCYFAEAKAAICICDITKSTTFREALDWLELFKNQVKSDKSMPYYLIINKIDLANIETCEEWIDNYGNQFSKIFYISCKDTELNATKINDVLIQLNQDILDYQFAEAHQEDTICEKLEDCLYCFLDFLGFECEREPKHSLIDEDNPPAPM
jgi:Ras-related protein Rab-7L1